MLKKIGRSLLILLLIIIAAFFIWRLINYIRDPDPDKTFILPRVELAVVEISSITVEKMEMVSHLLIKNQMPFSFTADSIQYSIYINEIEMVKSSYKNSLTLETNDTGWVSMPMTIYTHVLDSLIKANEKRNIDSVIYRVKASFYTNILFKRKFDIDIHRYFPLVHIPQVKMEHIEVDSLSIKGAGVLLHASIINQNYFPLKAKDIAFEFEIEDNGIVKGTIPGYTIIEPHNKNQLAIPVNISFKEVRKTLYELLKKGSAVKYNLHLRMKMVSNLNMLDNCNVILESAGSVKSLLKVVRNKPSEAGK